MVHRRRGARPHPFSVEPGEDPGDPPIPAWLIDVSPEILPAAITSQATTAGRKFTLGRDSLADGRLTLGYGDLNVNTGPISVIAFDPSDSTCATLLADTATDELRRFRRMGGEVYAPSMDPVGTGTSFVVTSAGGWQAITAEPGGAIPNGVHSFDVALTSHGLYVCGARDGDGAAGVAFVRRSTDDGDTWTEPLTDPSPTSGLHRFYGFGRVGNRLVVNASDDGEATYLCDETGDWTEITRPTEYGAASPPVWGVASWATGAHVWTLDGDDIEEVTATYCPLGALSILANNGDDYLYVSSDGMLATTSGGEIGDLSAYSSWSACWSTDGHYYMSNGVGIYRLDA